MDRSRERILVQCEPSLNELACPPIQIYATNIDDLYVTHDPLVVHLLEVDALNVEEGMDLIPSIKFLSREKVDLVRRKVGRKWISLRHKFPHQEISRWHEGEVGMFTRRVGNILQAFSCTPRVVPVMEMDSCFAEIPVWVDGVFSS